MLTLSGRVIARTKREGAKDGKPWRITKVVVQEEDGSIADVASFGSALDGEQYGEGSAFSESVKVQDMYKGAPQYRLTADRG